MEDKNMKLRHGDALEIMNEIIRDGIRVDAIITDPPYGQTACSWDSIIPLDGMWDRLKKIRKELCPILLFGSEPFGSHVRMSNVEEYKYDWIWNKGFGRGHLRSQFRPLQQTEFIMVFGRGRVNYYPIKKKRPFPVLSKEAMRTSIMGGKQAENYRGKIVTEFLPTNLIKIKVIYF